MYILIPIPPRLTSKKLDLVFSLPITKYKVYALNLRNSSKASLHHFWYTGTQVMYSKSHVPVKFKATKLTTGLLIISRTFSSTSWVISTEHWSDIFGMSVPRDCTKLCINVIFCRVYFDVWLYHLRWKYSLLNPLPLPTVLWLYFTIQAVTSRVLLQLVATGELLLNPFTGGHWWSNYYPIPLI